MGSGTENMAIVLGKKWVPKIILKSKRISSFIVEFDLVKLTRTFQNNSVNFVYQKLYYF